MELLEVIATLIGYGIGLGVTLSSAIAVVLTFFVVLKHTVGRWWPGLFID